AECADGARVTGESRSPCRGKRIRRVYLAPAAARAVPEAIEAIREADCIVLGPGSLFTSILPNLLVPEIALAIKESGATKVYVCNVMTQAAATDGFTASDHVKARINHVSAG